MKIEKLSAKYKNQLKDLIQITVNNLEKTEWLITLSDEEIENIFDNPNVIMYGIIENEKLLAVSGLFFDKSDYKDIMKLLDIEKHKVAEIAECMTHPSARGNNLMLKINLELVNKAKELGFEYLIATAHPDNISSNRSLYKLGMQTTAQIYRYGKYLRNCYIMRV